MRRFWNTKDQAAKKWRSKAWLIDPKVTKISIIKSSSKTNAIEKQTELMDINLEELASSLFFPRKKSAQLVETCYRGTKALLDMEPTQLNTNELKRVGDQKAFYFYDSLDSYTGQQANSLEEFAQKIVEVNSRSLEFHLYRGDFEKWIRHSLKEETLAERMEILRKKKTSEDNLRSQLFEAVMQHIVSLRKTGINLYH